MSSDRERIEEWALVLVAEGVAARVEPTTAGYELRAVGAEAGRAESILAAYEAENPPTPPAEVAPPRAAAALPAALAAVAALLVFFAATGPRDPHVVWFARGSADAERILDGETWRVVTALTLHADRAHVLANAVAGALFLTALGRTLGAGVALALALLAGAGGNALNAFVHGSSHVSVGASTAVFGAVGLLGGLALVRQHRRGVRGHRLWTPLAAAFALLAMLGTGERSDVWAHLFGLGVGAALGTAFAFAVRSTPAPFAQWLVGSGAVAAILYTWALALA